MQVLKGGGVAVPDHVWHASLALQLDCTSWSNKPIIRAKELKMGDYKVDKCLLDVPDDEDIVVIDDSTETKN